MQVTTYRRQCKFYSKLLYTYVDKMQITESTDNWDKYYEVNMYILSK